jgi:hypothetical protein
LSGEKQNLLPGGKKKTTKITPFLAVSHSNLQALPSKNAVVKLWNIAA